ncbi:hypothetical protein [Litorilituus lipolyticus]|uniref:Uncharacterized protein n=1 Tax=Litorilituus lipolyticus TaxID=2491017 RepID=A0A502L8I0_9GAMM|nr:hypothetical protein [Litorilituus lipolyticus]TPH18383.1 hypothetical protein EPA86_02525 [Litorilituus lipolyticus]
MNIKNCILSIGLFFAVFCITASHAISTDEKIKSISFYQLKQQVAIQNIVIIDRIGMSNNDNVLLNIAPNSSAELWVKALVNAFDNTLYKRELTDSDKLTYKHTIFLLPEGESAVTIEAQAEQFKSFDISARTKNMNQAKKENSELSSLSEVKSLAAMFDKQKDLTLHYSRIVNPNNIADYYTFDVNYSNKHQMFMPSQNNSMNTSGKMEGFSSFASIYKFIDSQKLNLVAFRDGKDLYLKLKKEPESFIMLSGNEDNMEIVLRNASSLTLKFDNYITGGNDQFTSIGKFSTNSKVITLLDTVEGK